jgi:hypothetical protein
VPPNLLHPGGVYGWSVEADLPDGTTRKGFGGKFQVLSQQELGQAARDLSNPRLGHLEKARLAAKMSLFDEAEKQIGEATAIQNQIEEKIRVAKQTGP